jgi:diadenosine tetraphosphatase ApaH/serine/threonine PP2A family protein phosphatase
LRDGGARATLTAMKLALLSDVHANLQAFDACIADACRSGAERFVLLGDFVGYGGDPAVALERVMQLVDDGALAVRGNHDDWAVQPPARNLALGERSAAWTHAQLSSAQRDFLAALPLVRTLEDCLFVHASAHEPDRWTYVDDTSTATRSLLAAQAQHSQTRFVFGGHVHRQSLYYLGSERRLMAFAPTPGIAIPTPRHRSWLATVGSVGQPRDGRPDAMYALFDTQSARLRFQRVPYDIDAAMRAIERAGADDHAARRLALGR